jgi:prepilin peptidase CpaA
MHGTYFQYGLLAALAIALLIAAFTDFRSRQIANWLNGAVALGAPFYWWASGLSLLPSGAWFTGPPSIVIQFAVALAAFGVLAGLFAIRAMGGGDVKLLTALALWLPWNEFLQLVLIMSVVGGVLTIVFGSWHVMRRRKDRLAIPYGVAIAVAGLSVLCTNYFTAAVAMSGTPG